MSDSAQAASPRSRRGLERWAYDYGVHLLAASVLMLLSVLQRWGEITSDTKLDLTEDPGGFLQRSLTLWNPDTNFGELQNQAYGYLFPQGTFFWLGELAGVPPWLTQRLWSGLLLVLAYEGARRLWRAIADDGHPVSGLAVGLAYALSPRLLGLDGVLTGEIVPTVVLPWMVLPLALARTGRMSGRSASLASSATLLFCGGLNAVENLAILPLPFLVLLVGIRRPGAWRNLAWWCGGVVLASVWWMGPLVVMGAYSPPFLDYIETAAATTGPLDWVNALRGADHWVGFTTAGSEPVWPASYLLSVTGFGIVMTAVVAAVSFAGLFHRAMPWRGPLVTSALLGLVCLTVAHAGTASSPIAEWVRDLLNGPLAPFRNVHKVDPLVRLPLALGVGHVAWLATRMTSRRRQSVRASALVLLVATVVVGGFPLLTGQMRAPGWTDIPQPWREAVDLVERERTVGRTLVLPGAGFGDQTWGRTVDEPIQAISSTPWVSRTQVPLVPGPTVRVMDSLEERLTDGTGSPVLGDVLARAGIEHVIVRRDLDPSGSGAPPPNRVDMALGRSGGITRVAGFGVTSVGGLPLIEVYRVDRPPVRVDAVATDALPVVAGSTGDLLAAVEAGLVPAERPTLFRADSSSEALDVQSDGFRRVQRQFGRVHDATSGVLSENDPERAGMPTEDYLGVPGEERTVLSHASVVSADASSSRAFADNFGSPDRDSSPYAAIDGDGRTRWQPSLATDPLDAWIAFELREARDWVPLTVQFAKGPGWARVRSISVDTGQERLEVPVDPATGLATARISGESKMLRISVSRVLPDEDATAVGIREVWGPDLEVGQHLDLPEAGAGQDTSFLFRNRPPRPVCTPTLGGPVCEQGSGRDGEAARGTSREFTLAEPSELTLVGQAIPRALPAVRLLTEPLDPRLVRVRSSSTFGEDPLVAPQFAFDGSGSTAWVSDDDDPSPRLHLRWGERRTLTRLLVTPTATAGRPAVAVLRAGDEKRVVPLDGQFSDGSFEPLRTDRVSIELRRASGVGEQRPVGVTELEIDGLQDLRHELDPEMPTGATCGLGPSVTVDGDTVRTRVTGTLEQVSSGSALRFESCERNPIRLDAGDHRVTIEPSGQFTPGDVALVATGSRHGLMAERSVEVRDWSRSHRRVEVGAGEEAVLRVTENANAGWIATLDGKQLPSVRPDGWQQGFVVPAGSGGVVTLEFAPNSTYRILLVVGGILALLLCAAVGGSLTMDRRRTVAAPTHGLRSAGIEVPEWLRWGSVAPVWLLGGWAAALGYLVGAALRRMALPLGVLLLLSAGLSKAVGAPVPGGVPAVLGGCAIGLLVASLTPWKGAGDA